MPSRHSRGVMAGLDPAIFTPRCHAAIKPGRDGAVVGGVG